MPRHWFVAQNQIQPSSLPDYQTTNACISNDDLPTNPLIPPALEDEKSIPKAPTVIEFPSGLIPSRIIKPAPKYSSGEKGSILGDSQLSTSTFDTILNDLKAPRRLNLDFDVPGRRMALTEIFHFPRDDLRGIGIIQRVYDHLFVPIPDKEGLVSWCVASVLKYALFIWLWRLWEL
ncbi:hypothetical protein ACLMJK_007076 [Lecanora helva]